jgi:hypothetical protein
LRLGHEERLGDVIAGEGTDVELDVIRVVVVAKPEADLSGFGPPRLPSLREAMFGHNGAIEAFAESPVLERWLASSQSVGEQQGTVRRAEPCE